jgi:hypothetical protein
MVSDVCVCVCVFMMMMMMMIITMRDMGTIKRGGGKKMIKRTSAASSASIPRCGISSSTIRIVRSHFDSFCAAFVTCPSGSGTPPNCATM